MTIGLSRRPKRYGNTTRARTGGRGGTGSSFSRDAGILGTPGGGVVVPGVTPGGSPAQAGAIAGPPAGNNDPGNDPNRDIAPAPHDPNSPVHAVAQKDGSTIWQNAQGTVVATTDKNGHTTVTQPLSSQNLQTVAGQKPGSNTNTTPAGAPPAGAPPSGGADIGSGGGGGAGFGAGAATGKPIPGVYDSKPGGSNPWPTNPDGTPKRSVGDLEQGPAPLDPSLRGTPPPITPGGAVPVNFAHLDPAQIAAYVAAQAAASAAAQAGGAGRQYPGEALPEAPTSAGPTPAPGVQQGNPYSGSEGGREPDAIPEAPSAIGEQQGNPYSGSEGGQQDPSPAPSGGGGTAGDGIPAAPSFTDVQQGNPYSGSEGGWVQPSASPDSGAGGEGSAAPSWQDYVDSFTNDPYR